jgi:hypothetical protein
MIWRLKAGMSINDLIPCPLLLKDLKEKGVKKE